MQTPTGKREHNMTLCNPGIRERREGEGGKKGQRSRGGDKEKDEQI